MPRGVPASGYRRTRPRPADEITEPTDTAMAVDDPSDVDDSPVPVEETPTPAPAPEELTPEQLEIKALRDRLARSEGRKDTEPEVEEITTPGDDGNIVIHFLEDGLTGLGRVFYRGDELEFDPQGQAYKDTFDRNGRSWLDLRNNEFGQVDRWGKIMFRNGPWPGKTYKDGNYEGMRSDRDPNVSLKPPTEEELAAAEKARARRAAPKLPSMV